MLQSMTGFARQTIKESFGELTLELRSVNHRYLEFQFRLPESFRLFEMEMRELVGRYFSRGKIDIIFNLQAVTETLKQQINWPAVTELAQIETQINAILPLHAVSLREVLNWPGILYAQEAWTEQQKEKIFSLLNQGILELKKIREQEGVGLKNFLGQKLEQCKQHSNTLNQQLPALQQQLKARYQQKINEYVHTCDEHRVAQEIAVILQRTDVAEECHRLMNHFAEMEKVLNHSGVIGRKLDFLLQEMHREANTLGSKIPDAALCHHVIEIKLLLEQMREQVQNVE